MRFSSSCAIAVIEQSLGSGDSDEEEASTVVEQARLEEVGSGQAPVTEGWFVVNAADGP